MAGQAAISSDNTFQKAAANLRWLVEKSGVNPETLPCVCIVAACRADQDKIAATIGRELKMATDPDRITAHGIRFVVTVKD